jgi:hypothetical protein
MKISYLIPALFTPGIFTPSRRELPYGSVFDPMMTRISSLHNTIYMSLWLYRTIFYSCVYQLYVLLIHLDEHVSG